MTILEAMAHASRALLALVALLALFDWLRHRERERLVVVLMLASLGIPSAVAELPETVGGNRVLQTVNVSILLAQPFLTLLLVGLFRRVPRALLWGAGAAGIVSEVLYLATAPEIPRPMVLFIIGYFVVGTGYASWVMFSAMLRSGGAFRTRLGFAGAGSGLLALLFFVAGVAQEEETLREVSAAVMPALVAICFYLAFIPPHWLRQAWQLPELHRFLQTVGSARPADRPAQAAQELCRATTRVTGAIASAVLIWDAKDKVLRVETSDAARIIGRTLRPVDPGPSVRAWTQGAPARSSSRQDMSSIAHDMKAESVLAVPIQGKERSWGVLASYRPLGLLFPEDKLELMSILAAQYSIVLENAELLRAQEELVAHLQNANEEMEAFTYSISHDLRRPLRGIDGFSDALLEEYAGKLDEQGVHYLNRVREAAQAMGRQIDDLLKLSRVTREQLRVQRLDLSRMVRSITDEMKEREPERRIAVKVADGLAADGDPNLMPIVLHNLLENAWKFTGNREDALIEVGKTQVNGEAVFYVKDNGAGFRSDSAEKLFRPFQRLHNQKEFPGTGIGLATVWWIVRRHGGRAWAEGALDQGATFYFTLPEKGLAFERGLDFAGRRLAG